MLGSELTFADVLSCVFDMRQHESTTYLILLDTSGGTSQNLLTGLTAIGATSADHSTTLREKDLVARECQLLDGGRQVYQYTPTPFDETKELMHETLDAGTAYVTNESTSMAKTRVERRVLTESEFCVP